MTQRELKFRAWDKGRLEMFIPEVIDHRGNVFDSVRDYENYIINDQCVVMQYTGLKDKHGKEIYEGDILQYKHECKCRAWNQPGENRSLATTQPDVTIGKDKVWFDNGCFRLGYVAYLHELPNVFRHGENHASEWSETYTDFEVIGNIYENPELL